MLCFEKRVNMAIIFSLKPKHELFLSLFQTNLGRCKQKLDYSWFDRIRYFFPGGVVNKGNKFIISNVQCTGQESSLFDCPHTEGFKCPSGKGVVVECTPMNNKVILTIFYIRTYLVLAFAWFCYRGNDGTHNTIKYFYQQNMQYFVVE